jgi:membrane-bound acyltransferase YfiQ involved in biofilm formation
MKLSLYRSGLVRLVKRLGKLCFLSLVKVWLDKVKLGKFIGQIMKIFFIILIIIFFYDNLKNFEFVPSRV